MIEMIKEYRESPDRTHIRMNMTTGVCVSNGKKGKVGKNTPLWECSGVKRGSYVYKKEIDLRLCDIMAVLGGALAVFILMKKLFASSDRCLKDDSAEKSCCEEQ